LKRERRPPKTWRRNMMAGLALLLVLDGTIVLPGPDLVRGVLALVVTLVVGGFIIAVWRSNSRMEKAAAKGGDGEAASGSAGLSAK
jgi:hypothetical protein